MENGRVDLTTMCVVVASDMCVVVCVTKHIEMDIEQGIKCWLALQTDFVEQGICRLAWVLGAKH